MDSGLAVLLSAAATTLVTSMTTDSWEQVKTAFMRLWRRPEQAKAVSADLDDARSDVVAARSAGDEQAETDLVTEWQSRLGRLVAGDEELQEALRRFAGQFRHLLDGHDRTGQVVMRAEVHGPGRVNQAGHDQTVIG